MASSARRMRALGALGCLLGSACGTDTAGSGVVVVPFQLGNQRSCEALGVQRVRGELDEGLLAEEVDCRKGAVRFDYVPEGAYRVRLFGLSEDGVEIMDSLRAGEISVRAMGAGRSVTVDPAVQLTAAPAQLWLRWEFGFSSCAAAGVGRFEVSAWRADGSQLLMQTSVPCDMPGEGSDQFRTIPDDARQLLGDEFGEVSVQPLDLEGGSLGEPVSFRFTPPGAGRTVRLSLSCSPYGCRDAELP